MLYVLQHILYVLFILSHYHLSQSEDIECFLSVATSLQVTISYFRSSQERLTYLSRRSQLGKVTAKFKCFHLQSSSTAIPYGNEQEACRKPSVRKQVPRNMNSIPVIRAKIRHSTIQYAGSLGQTHRPRVQCSTYYFFFS